MTNSEKGKLGAEARKQALSPERRAEIGRMGGKAAWASGKAHRWTDKDAAEAGRKGGKQTHANKRKARKGSSGK